MSTDFHHLGTHRHRLLDEAVEVLGDLGREPRRLEDAQDLLSGDGLDLGNAVRVTQNHANLGGGQALLGERANL